MENKKLINILINNMRELEELIAGIKQNRAYEPLEIDFLQTKAQGIRQLLEMLKGRSFVITEQKTEIVNEIPEQPSPEPTLPFEPQEVKEMVKEEPDQINQDKDIEEAIKVPASVPEQPVLPEPLVENKEEVDSEQENQKDDIKNDSNEDVDLEEEDKSEEKHTIGDSFIKEKSVNDLINDSGSNLEYKLSNRPVSNLKSAIGINDRFLFTRELFDGNSDEYNTAITKLDNLESIQEAVTYLRENFKWKKNDTSLKFISLVKRRFADA